MGLNEFGTVKGPTDCLVGKLKKCMQRHDVMFEIEANCWLQLVKKTLQRYRFSSHYFHKIVLFSCFLLFGFVNVSKYIFIHIFCVKALCSNVRVQCKSYINKKLRKMCV